MIHSIIQTALQEDLGDGDHSSLACIPADAKGEAKLLVKDTGILRSEEHTSELQSQFHLLYPPYFFNDPAPPEIYPLPLHDALPISAIIHHWPAFPLMLRVKQNCS